MICHKHKCIFIHIPRCAGTSIESAIVGRDWWNICKEQKHIYASVAKRIYHKYWEEYFKFTIIRNPWDRVVSLSKYSWFYGVHIRNEQVNLNQYIKKFPEGEIDPRCELPLPDEPHIGSSVYANYMNEELDYIGEFENLHEDWKYIQDAIGCNKQLPHAEKNKRSNCKHYTEYYDSHTRQLVASKYATDIDIFNYTF